MARSLNQEVGGTEALSRPLSMASAPTRRAPMPAAAFGQSPLGSEVRRGRRTRFVCVSVIRSLHRQGYSFREIASVTGAGYGTVRRAFHDIATLHSPAAEAPEREATRLFDILKIAEEAFDTRNNAILWLREPNVQLGEQRPVDALSTQAGFRAVKTILRQIQYGVFG